LRTGGHVAVLQKATRAETLQLPKKTARLGQPTPSIVTFVALLSHCRGTIALQPLQVAYRVPRCSTTADIKDVPCVRSLENALTRDGGDAWEE
jgi:hypothetical protein